MCTRINKKVYSVKGSSENYHKNKAVSTFAAQTDNAETAISRERNLHDDVKTAEDAGAKKPVAGRYKSNKGESGGKEKY